jgi:predicted dehydrogenase
MKPESITFQDVSQTLQTTFDRAAAPKPEPLPVGVIGCGRMGKLHARVYSQMAQVRLVGVYDADDEVAKATVAEFGGEVFPSPESLAERVAAVTVAAPTNNHAAVAEPFLRRGVATLIEKPLAKDVEEAQQIVAWAREHKAVLQVGHIERFNPAIRAMRRLDIRPRFIEVTRISPLTFRSIDVGVVLDMMIHDIDIVLMLACSPVKRIDATGVGVIGDVEDICNARITFENGCVANMTASRLALKTERRMRVFSNDAYVSLDYQKRYGIVASRTPNLGAIRNAVSKIRAGEIDDLSQLNFAELVNVEELQIDDVEPLRAELESFVEAAHGKCPPVVTGEDGLAAVELAMQIVKAIPPEKLA